MIDPTIAAEFSGSKVIVTGGTGMIGRQVVALLCDFGANVTSVSLDEMATDPRANQVIADLTDFSVCRNLTENVDFVFHIAGIKGSVEVTRSQPASFLVPLLMMNTNLLDAASMASRKLSIPAQLGPTPPPSISMKGTMSGIPCRWMNFPAGRSAWLNYRLMPIVSNMV